VSPAWPQGQRRVAFLPFVRTSLNSLIPTPYDFEPKTLGEHIHKRRLYLGMLQAGVASLFGVSPFTIGNWENGITKPGIHHIPTLIEFLGYDPEPQNPSTIAEYLAAKRRELGWTQRTAAQGIGVDPCSWSSWESGGTILLLKHRRLVASFLGLSECEIHIEMRDKWNALHWR